jgi:hypothetical protein
MLLAGKCQGEFITAIGIPYSNTAEFINAAVKVAFKG